MPSEVSGIPGVELEAAASCLVQGAGLGSAARTANAPNHRAVSSPWAQVPVVIHILGQAQWHTLVSPSLGRYREGDQEFMPDRVVH